MVQELRLVDEEANGREAGVATACAVPRLLSMPAKNEPSQLGIDVCNLQVCRNLLELGRCVLQE